MVWSLIGRGWDRGEHASRCSMNGPAPRGKRTNVPPRLAREAGRGYGTSSPPDPPRLHGLLGATLIVIVLAFLTLPYLGIAKPRPVDALTPLIEYGFAGFAIGLI